VKFELGQCVITRAAHAYAEKRGLVPLLLLQRHARGDWGDLDAHDRQLNEIALRESGRIFSAYDYGGERWYVITEWDRSVTTILLASDY
jgi:hypothetical protein